ncbi:MAG: methyltransferase family protein [Alphaproteobacteria bacterium]
MHAAPPTAPRHAGVVAPPPLIFGGALLAGLGVDWAAGWSTGFAAGARWGVAMPLLAGALVLLAGALAGFRRAGTHPAPWRPSTAVVTGGVYRVTRNPMYLGMAALHAGLALLLDAPAALLLLVPAVLAIHFGVILREERYLEATFGEPYRAYRARVRRWL